MDGRCRLLCAGLVLHCTISVTPSAAYSQVVQTSATAAAAPEMAPTDIRRLVLGDSYRIAVKRQQTTAEYDGIFVKATRDWIVLMTIAEGRSEHSTPVLRDIPYVNRLFRNVGIGRTTLFHWLPRGAAVVKGRMMASKMPALLAPHGEQPANPSQCEADVVKDGKQLDDLTLVAIDPRHLTCRRSYSETVQHPSPVLGKLPLVGDSFTRQETEFKQEELNIPLTDVLCITERVPDQMPAAE